MAARKVVPVLAVLLAWSASVQSQVSKPQFDVASIKPKKTGGEDAARRPPFPFSPVEASEDNIHVSPATLTMRDVTLNSCIKWAYGVQDSQVSGPDWLNVDRFDITAKPPGPATEEQLRVMLQNLLAERSKLALHRESRNMAGYAIVAGKSGPKMKTSESAGEPVLRGRLRIEAQRYSMPALAGFLSRSIEAYVADMTDLKGRYDFVIDIAPYFSVDTPVLRTDHTALFVSVYDRALQPIGLRLVARKVPVDVLVIDHAERPSEN